MTTPALTKNGTSDGYVLCEGGCGQTVTQTPITTHNPYVITVPVGVSFTATSPNAVFSSGTEVMSQSQNGVININANPGRNCRVGRVDAAYAGLSITDADSP